jgi:hypothetical protein
LEGWTLLEGWTSSGLALSALFGKKSDRKLNRRH